ncbi:MAG: polysaccharide deacetylase family protein [Vicinamibacterales bacterium]
MTRPTIGAVVRCADLVAGVYDTVASLLGGSTPADAVAVVADPSTPRIADAWLAAFANARRVRFLRVDTLAPGAGWNAGLDAIGPVDVAVCIESGDVFERSALDLMSRPLSSGPAVTLVTSGIEWVGPGSRRAFTVPSGSVPSDLLADPAGAHVSSLFRWSQWRTTTGFDEQMPALEHTDFWLTLLGHGGTVAVETLPLLRRRVHARALYRRTWMTGDYRRAVDALLEHHWDVAAASPHALLESKERAAIREGTRHEGLVNHLRRAQGEIERLAARRSETLASVPPEWKSSLDLGALARTTPLSHEWGYDRGTPVDRPLIERYLAAHAEDIRGTVLEIQENDYARKFGASRLERADVLDLDVGNARATTIGDLRAVDHIASETYDAIVLTQTLHVIGDMRAVIRECERLLKPGGVLLATLPSASRVCLEYGPEGDFWRVTDAGARRLFAEVFPAFAVDTTALGNALVNAGFGFGLASEELPAGAYDTNDPYFPMVIGVRARKSGGDRAGLSMTRPKEGARGVVLMYHRVGAGGSDPYDLFVSEATFREQLEWLGRVGSVLSLEELACGVIPSRPTRAIALTFDDGYVDNIAVAAPLLRAAGCPATFFLTTGGGRHPYHYWWDRLAAALDGQTPVPPTLVLDLPSGRLEIATATEPERRVAHWRVYDEIVRLPAGKRDEIVDRIAAWASLPALDIRDRRMTWDEVGDLASEPRHAIGAHTVDHLFLPAQTDDVLMGELVESRAVLERHTGRRIESLAYPFGAVDARTVAAARDAGFRVAVTCVDGPILPSDDLLALPRIAVKQEPLDQFIARVERAWSA